MAKGFATIGHSDRTVETIEEMLVGTGIELLVDVRSFPRSRHNPAFNIDTFPARLKALDIDYVHMADLGGRRPRQPEVPEAVNALWQVQAFHNYADYALGPVYGAAFDQLSRLGNTRRVALMCAEAMWWRCHRRIIADYLMLNGQAVAHLMEPGKSVQASPTPGAMLRPDGKVIYPPTETDRQPAGS